MWQEAGVEGKLLSQLYLNRAQAGADKGWGWVDVCELEQP